MVVCRRSADPEWSHKCEKCWLDNKCCVQPDGTESESSEEEQSEEDEDEDKGSEEEKEFEEEEVSDEFSEDEVSDAIVIYPTADLPATPTVNLFQSGAFASVNHVDYESVWRTAIARRTRVGEHRQCFSAVEFA